MIRSVWARSGIAAAATVLVSMGSVGSAVAADDTLSLKIASALRSDRLVMRAGGIFIKVKTKSGDTYDVTGNVVSKQDLLDVFTSQASRDVIALPDNPLPATGPTSTPEGFRQAVANSLKNTPNAIPLVINTLDRLGLDGIGTPPGIKGVAQDSLSTGGISLGYYLDDEYKWFVETYVLAAPISVATYASGTSIREGVATPIAIDGKKIVTSKLLPPTAIFGRYWGAKDNIVRPYTGLMATYSIFYDTKATPDLNTYQGGGNPGDTSVSLRNSFGLGPVVGVQVNLPGNWHASLNVGSVKLKTQAKIVTRNTTLTGDAAVLNDLGQISADLDAGEGVYAIDCPDTNSRCQSIRNSGGLTSLVMKGILAQRGVDNFGTFERRTDVVLKNTLFMLSVGKAF